MKRLLGALVFLLVPTLAHASPITFGFTGTISSCFICSVPLPFDPTFQGQYTFDSVAVDQDSRDNIAVYVFSGAPYGGFLEVGGNTITWEGLQIVVGNDISAAVPGLLSDRYQVSSGGTFIFSLQGCNGDIFQDTSLPLAQVDLIRFRPNCALGDEVVIHGGSQVVEAFGSLSTLFTVPESPAWLLFGFGLIIVGLQRRLA